MQPTASKLHEELELWPAPVCCKYTAVLLSMLALMPLPVLLLALAGHPTVGY